jgi:hypothetical protein
MATNVLIRVAVTLSIGACVAAACSATDDTNGFEASGTGAQTGTGQGTGGLGLATSTGSGTGGGILMVEPPCEGVDPSIDNDLDGWTGASGDCNDCTEQMNPGAQDYTGNNIDEDCNGPADDNPIGCDGSLTVADSDPLNGARAMDLCKVAEGQSWGVISARYLRSDGQPLEDPNLQLGRGILDGFGPNVNPQEGVKLLALSSGAARQPNDPGYVSVSGFEKDFFPHGAPAGFPKESPSCPGVTTGEPYDSAGIEVVIRTPTNAKSLSFNLNFYTYEFPEYICSEFNDFFVALLSPPPANYPDGNISFDSMNNLISVNAGFLEVCNPQMAGEKNFPCLLGPSQLIGTGYDEQINGSAATGWLKTSSAVEDPGGEITLFFTIWDSGDPDLDSTVLLDNFVFNVDGAPTVTEPVDVPE